MFCTIDLLNAFPWLRTTTSSDLGRDFCPFSGTLHRRCAYTTGNYPTGNDIIVINIGISPHALLWVQRCVSVTLSNRTTLAVSHSLVHRYTYSFIVTHQFPPCVFLTQYHPIPRVWIVSMPVWYLKPPEAGLESPAAIKRWLRSRDIITSYSILSSHRYVCAGASEKHISPP